MLDVSMKIHSMIEMEKIWHGLDVRLAVFLFCICLQNYGQDIYCGIEDSCAVMLKLMFRINC